jgi:hypothetical protein
MKVFVGYGYNARDAWIENRVFPILRCVGFSVVHGKDMHGNQLQPEVQRRIAQSDAAIGFFTIREDAEAGPFNSHIWVRDEMLYAMGKEKPIIPIKENGVVLEEGLFGNRQYIPLDQNDRLACVSELLITLGNKNMRRVRLDPSSDPLRASVWGWKNTAGFMIRYRTQNIDGLESDYRNGRLEVIDQGFYLNLAEVPNKAYIEVEGVLNGAVQFSSGWVSADAVQIRVA